MYVLLDRKYVLYYIKYVLRVYVTMSFTYLL